jgi:hypothetical protein
MKLLGVFLLVIAAFTVVYSGIAVTINPRGDFASHRFPSLIADSLQEKRRLWQSFQSTHRVGGIILGSSRSMKLQPATFARAFGTPFFNFAVNGSHVEEMALVYDIVRKQGVRPKIVVIGLDLEALHSDNLLSIPHIPFVKLRKEIDAAVVPPPSRIEQISDAATALNRTFTLSYTNDMIRSVEIKAHPAQLGESAQLIDPDGYMRYPGYEAERRAGTFDLDKQIRKVQNYYVERFKAMTALSPRRKAALEQLITKIQGDGGRIILWITTLHPRLVAQLNAATPYPELLKELRAYVKQLHTRYGIAVTDCSDITFYGGSETGWYDGAHVDESNAALITRRILNQP